MACRSTVLYSLAVALLFCCQLYSVHAQEIVLNAQAAPVSESVGVVEACIAINPAPTTTTTVTLQTAANVADAGSDYVALSREFTFNSGDSDPQCANVTILDDTAVENTFEFFDLEATSAGLMTESATVIIRDNDQITIGLETIAYTIPEAPSTVTICAEILEGSVEISTEFTFEPASGSAESGIDFLLAMTMGEFQSGENRTCTSTTILDDNRVESTENFTVTLTGSDVVVVSNTASTATVFIEDDDGVTVSLTDSALSVNESNSGTTVPLCVSLDSAPGPIDRDTDVVLNTAAGTADISDFQPLSNQILTIPSTTTVGSSVCQQISIIGDTVEEDDESFTVTVSVASPNTFTPPVSASVTILNDDVANCPVLSIANGMVRQNSVLGSVATYTCDSGYILQGNENRTCRADSSWTGTSPGCTVVSCMALIDPMNGVVTVGTTTFNSQADYTCNVGFELVGNSSRTCQANATWTGEEPDCNGAREMRISLLFILVAVVAVLMLH